MKVSDILATARQRLAILHADAPLISASILLANRETPLIVVCDDTGAAIGVITRTDIVRKISSGAAVASAANAGTIMTGPVFACREDDRLQSVWDDMNLRGLKCAPVLDRSGRPAGVVHAREVVRALLDEVTYEELLLRDYVLGIGYR